MILIFNCRNYLISEIFDDGVDRKKITGELKIVLKEDKIITYRLHRLLSIERERIFGGRYYRQKRFTIPESDNSCQKEKYLK